MARVQLPKPALSRREREIAALVAEGLTNREIAARLFISERTVDGHLEHVREKLSVNSRAQVAAWFVAQSQATVPALADPYVRAPLRSQARTPIAWTVLAAVLLTGVAVAFWRLTPAGPIITTVAGSSSAHAGISGAFRGDNGPATSAALSRPIDVAVSQGYLYIADTRNERIRRVDLRGTISTLAGGGTRDFTEGRLPSETNIGSPEGIAVGPDGLAYFSTRLAGGLVARVTRGQASETILEPILARPGITPSGMCFAPDGSLYIADYLRDRVWLLTPDGTLMAYAGTGGHGFAGDGGPALGAELRYPNRLALDKEGNLYIADEGNNRIRRVDHKTGVITTVAGSSDIYGFGGDGGLAVGARLSLPAGVAVASNGDIYIADTGNNRIRRVEARTQIITTVAGTGAEGFGGDGRAASNATLYGPVAVAMTSLGDLYIVDLGNHRVRLVRGVGVGSK